MATPAETAAIKLPKHLGIIPDGNRRWARERGLPTLAGHKHGLDVMKGIGLATFDSGVKCLTMFGFSTENWKRSKDEVKYLMALFYTFLREGLGEFEERGIRFRLVGSREGLPKRLVRLIERVEARTERLTNGTLALCLNYGGEQEMIDAFKKMLEAGVKPEDVTPQVIEQYLYAPGLPPLDLVIRTSGEQRSSGFMLWRSAYTEYCFSEKNWPDFNENDLNNALDDFAARQRRFGK